MDSSEGSQRFSFGEVAESNYVSFQMISVTNKLSYNPFYFDLSLTILKTKPNYQQVGTTFALSRQKTVVFCRKKKQEPEVDSNTEYRFLNAEIISSKHFSINEHYVIRDLGSKHGTFFWIDRSNPRKIESKDIYLIGRHHLEVTKVTQLPKKNIEFTYKGKHYQINEQKKLYLIGSHPKCDLVIASLYQFEVCINLPAFTIFTHLQEEEADMDHGLWYRLRPDKNQQIVLEHGNLLMVDPYIFRLSS